MGKLSGRGNLRVRLFLYKTFLNVDDDPNSDPNQLDDGKKKEQFSPQYYKILK